MKKAVCILIFLLYSFSFAMGQVRGPQDVVLLLDVSASLKEAKSYVVDVFLKDRLKFGDTFHLIAFSDTSRLVMTQKIMGNADLESVRRQALALAQTTAKPDVRQALAFAQDYVASLSTQRQKKITLVSRANIPQPTQTSAAFKRAAASFEQIKPQQPAATAPKPAVTPQSPTAQPAKPAVTQPTAPQPKPLQPPQPATQPATPQTPPVTAPQPKPAQTPPVVQSATPPATSPQPEPPASSQDSPDTPEAKEPEKSPASRPPKIITPQVPPSEQAIRVLPKPSRISAPSPRALNLLFAACYFFTFFLLLMMRRSLLSINRTFALVSTDFDGLLLSLFVGDQNTNIGRRNIHVLARGATLGLGGGKSDFLIFLVPLPQNIAQVRFDGDHCSFVPRKKGFFPEITTKTLPDCIGKTIKIRSERNYDLFIRIIPHENPLAALNKLFLAVKLPGR